MKQYIVIAGSCFSCKMGIVYNAGDILTEETFIEGDAERLVKDGFLKEYKEPAKKTK